MTLCRMILPDWALSQGLKKVLEGEFSDKEIKELNEMGYNAYYLPNHPENYERGSILDGTAINVFSWVFVDYDTKNGIYPDKDAFIDELAKTNIPPTKVIDSGNGMHAYWRVTNLDAMSYLRFQRRLIRLLRTDEAVGQIFQLMRLPNTLNTKKQDSYVECIQLYEEDIQYTAEEFDRLLPPITKEDESYCKQHYERTYNINQNNTSISGELPPKFGKLLRDSKEVKELWTGDTDDRSKNDFRLGHLMFANGFTKEEACNVLVNSAKALKRAPVHRDSYATNIVEKIWTFELEGKKNTLSSSVKDILQRPTDTIKGKRIPAWKYIDDTDYGFRHGHVMGLVAGSGVGKTTMALNIFMAFVVSNPDLDHFFCPLEQPDREIAERWKVMCGPDEHLYDKVHVLSNYDENGTFRDLSLNDIKKHILEFERTLGKKVGCVVIDHIGVLCNNNKLGQDEGTKEIAKSMKGFAEETDTFLIMQSQTSRSKAGIGDLELDKDAAFGTSVFENFCDFLVTLWQPLKRVYGIGAPTIMSYKFCKIRHKKQTTDVIKEDERYSVFFDPETQLIRPIRESDGDIGYWMARASSKRKADKNDVADYTSIQWVENEAGTNSSK